MRIERFYYTFVASFLLSAPLFCGVAYAQATHAAIDLTPYAFQGVDLLATVATALASGVSWFLIKWFSSKTRLNDTEMETMLAARLNDAIMYGINLAAAAGRKRLAEQGKIELQIDNPFIEIAANYVMRTMPDTLKQFGWTVEQVKRAVITRSEQYFGVNAAHTAAVTGLIVAEGDVASIKNGV